MRFAPKFFLIGYFLSSGILFAQENKDSVDVKHVAIDGVTIVSSQLNINKSASPLQLVTTKDIERLGITSVSEAVERFTGVTVKDYGGVGGIKTVSLRGFGAQHTGVAYDGITLNDAQAGMIDIGRISLDNVSSISLVHGQTNSIFQPARNFFSIGLLNIETNRPAFANNKKQEGKVDIRTGSFGLFNPAAYYAYKLSNTFSLSVNAAWQRSDGKYPFIVENGTTTENHKRNNGDVNTLQSEINLYGNLNPKDKLSVKAYIYNSDQGLPGAVILYNPYAAERLLTRNSFAQLQYQKDISAKFAYKLSAKFNYDYTKYSDVQEKYSPSGKIQREYIQHEYYLSNVLLYNLCKELSLSAAEDLSIARLRNDSTITYILQHPVRKSSISALSAQYENSRLVATMSLLALYSNDKVRNGEENTYKRITPSVAVSYSPLSSGQWHLRMSYKDIFRIPSLTEEYYKFVGAKLKPEQAKQVNLGTIWSTRLSDHVPYFNATIDGYYANVKDKIIIIPDGAFASTSNRGKVQMTGLDVNLNADITISPKITLRFKGGYSYLKAIDVLEYNEDNTPNKSYKNQIPYTPKHSGSGSLSIDNQWLNVSYSVIFSGRRYALDQNTKENKVNGYADHNISLNKQLILKSHEVFIQANFLNILNKNYQIIKYYPMPGRSFKVSVGYKF
ncbi:MAG: TonB-dependent receptor plug domain-containing protein [Dysgonomonas sp.]